MVSEAHCKSFPFTELLLFNNAKVKTVFHSMATLKEREKEREKKGPLGYMSDSLTIRPQLPPPNFYNNLV